MSQQVKRMHTHKRCQLRTLHIALTINLIFKGMKKDYYQYDHYLQALKISTFACSNKMHVNFRSANNIQISNGNLREVKYDLPFHICGMKKFTSDTELNC